jgi:hypothetical protein
MTAVFTWTQAAAGTYTWTCPAGVTAVKVECWAGGGGGGGNARCGGGGGEYAAEAALAVSAGVGYTVVVGAAGAGAAGAGATAGGNSTFATTSVVAHGGGGGGASGAPGTAGTGSTNTIHFNGGLGGDTNGGSGAGGGGGGSSAGTAGAGNAGGTSAGGASGTAGVAVTGGGPGGAGGNGTAGTGGSSPVSGPGGGGGGGGDHAGTGYAGANGWAGKVVITAVMASPAVFTAADAAWAFTAPLAVTSVTAECWGGGAGGFQTGVAGGAGGGGGEYAAEPALAVTPQGVYPFTVGAGGASDASGTSSVLAGDSVTVTAHPGLVSASDTAGGAGGTGSANSTHHDGGAGGRDGTTGGGGGGGSGGTAAAGNTGTAGTTTTGGGGAVAVTGGGPGGAGGNAGAAGSKPASGPGGGGGGAGYTSTTNGAGYDGQVRITFTPAAATVSGGLALRHLAMAGATVAGLVQQVPGSSVNDYGLAAAPVTSTAGNWLVVFAGWNLHPNYTSGPVPSVTVADSAGNAWVHLGTSGAGGYGSRSAVWACPNAMALGTASQSGWVSVALSAFASSLAWLVVEVQGMPLTAVPDVAVTDFINVVTTTTLKTFTKTTTWRCPANVTAVKAESWGPGGDGGAGIIGLGGAGGGGGEYAAEPAAVTTPGASYVITVPRSSGSSTVIPLDAVTVAAHSGGSSPSPGTPGAGGTGSANTAHFNGGAGGAGGSATGGGSGGSSASVPGPGIAGQAGTAAAPGAATPGLAAFTGSGGAGGARSPASHLPAKAGYPGGAPGGAGGGGGALNFGGPAFSNPGNGARGLARLTYTPSVSPVALVLTAAATVAGTGFYVLAAGNASVTVPSGPAGWTPLTPVTAGSGAAGVAIFPYWLPSAAAGTITASATTSTGASVSGVMATVAQNPPVPSQPNLAFPPLRVEAAFGAIPGDPSQPPPDWTDITSRVIAGSGQRWVGAVYGRAYELTTPEAGSTTIAVNNQDSALTPSNQESPYFPDVVSGVPVRVMAWWNGRWHHVAYDWAERWPQDWPDLPQWGISRMTGTDAVSVTAGVTLPSAVAGDILADNPYAYLICNEQYATTTQGLTVSAVAADAGGLIAVNQARGNQRPGIYVDALSIGPVVTGQALNLAGDSGTGFGITGITFPVPASPPATGAGIAYGDPGLPAMNSVNGLTVEFWAVITAIPPTGVTFFQGIGAPSIFHPAVPLLIWTNPGNHVTVSAADGTSFAGPVFVPSAAAQHIAVTLSGAASSILSIYYNGTLAATFGLTSAQVKSPLTAFTAAACQYGFATVPNPQNFTMGHVAVYDYELAASRIAAHYVTGSTGQSGSAATARFAQILAWGNLGVPRAGPATADGITMGAAYSLGGATAADGMNTVANSDSALIAAMPSGALTFLPRLSLFNITPKWALGDNAAAALNANADLNGGSVSPWSGYQCTVVLSQAQVHVLPNSLLITPAGGYAFCSVTGSSVPVVLSGSYTALAWVFSPGGYQQVNVGFDWLDASRGYLSTNVVTVPAPAGVWVLVTSPQQAPSAGAAYGSVHVGMTGTPSVTDLLYVSQPWMTAGNEIPFTAGQGFDWDNTYLKNVNSATQVTGPSQGITVTTRAPVSQASYFTRAGSPVQTIAANQLDTYDLSTWQNFKYQQSQIRVRGLTVDAAANPLAFDAVMSIRPGDVVTVSRRPVGGSPVTGVYMVQKVSHEIGPGVWKAAYEMSPYSPENSILQLDAAGYDVLAGGALP